MENTRYKILLIEDDKLDQRAFMRMVKEKKLSYDCTVAGSVSEAKSILVSGQFDIIISDYSLGDGTAFNILDLVKNTPVILVTGAGDEEVAVKAWKTGAYDYLTKDSERNYLKTVPITIENTIKHKRMEERLQLLSGAVMSTDDSVYITDMENKIIFVNKAFCETYGYEEQEIIGEDSNILWIGNLQNKNTRSVFQTRSVGSAWEVGFYHKRKNGSIFPVSLSRSIIRDENGNQLAVVGIARDISERMQIEDDLRTLNQELERQNRLKRELIIAVCHQLMAPISELKDIISSAATSTLGKNDSKLCEILQLADENVNRAASIVADFLDASKSDGGKAKVSGRN
jgi:PAS domain S-box-containing protein